MSAIRTRRRPAFGLSLVAAFVFSLVLVGAASAQSTQSASESRIQELKAALFYYYEKPTDIALLLKDLDEPLRARSELVIGFLAGVFAKHPETMEAAAGAKLGRDAQSAVFQSLRLADRHADAVAAAKQWGWPLEQMTRIGPVTPLRQLKVEHRSTLDALWGASFATGDDAYVRMIYDVYDSVASTRDVDVSDVVASGTLRRKSDKEKIETLKQKYPPETLKRLGLASYALVSLEANARQHKFVAAALDRYLSAQPDSPAAKGFNELRAESARRSVP